LHNLAHDPDDSFQWKWRFCERNKNCAAREKIQWKWNKLEESDNTSNTGATTWVKEDKTPNLGPFTGNPWVKQILSDPTKVWWIIELFSKTTSLICYARRLTCIIFKIKENMIAVLKCWNGWMSVLFVQLTKRSETRYISKFCIASLHKEECFERYHSPKH
jgi:hypothetical protein